MTWHLKDRELERKLDKFSDGKFSRILNEHTGPNESDCIVLELEKNNNIELSVYIRPEAIEEIADYNPKTWNKFPQVWPPENVRMRVEFQYKNKPEKTYHACFYFFSGKWYWDTCNYSIDPSIGNIRFRPWVD